MYFHAFKFSLQTAGSFYLTYSVFAVTNLCYRGLKSVWPLLFYWYVVILNAYSEICPCPRVTWFIDLLITRESDYLLRESFDSLIYWFPMNQIIYDVLHINIKLHLHCILRLTVIVIVYSDMIFVCVTDIELVYWYDMCHCDRYWTLVVIWYSSVWLISNS